MMEYSLITAIFMTLFGIYFLIKTAMNRRNQSLYYSLLIREWKFWKDRGKLGIEKNGGLQGEECIVLLCVIAMELDIRSHNFQGLNDFQYLLNLMRGVLLEGRDISTVDACCMAPQVMLAFEKRRKKDEENGKAEDEA